MSPCMAVPYAYLNWYLVWRYEEVNDVILVLLECLSQVFVVEVADLVLDGCLVVRHIRVVRGVVVLRQSIELILYARVCVCGCVYMV